MVGAFADLHGRRDVFDGISFAGMTDRAIVRAGLHAVRAVHEDVAEAEIDRVLEAYLAQLARELVRSDGYRVLPGVGELLASLRDAPGIAIGLGTGNVRQGAYAKLARGALDAAFSFGGFGCDAEDRVELLRAGARRGAERLAEPLDACRVIVIGDTPKDVAAAKGMRATCVGVGTGGFRPADLAACGAHHVFATLAEGAVRATLVGEA